MSIIDIDLCVIYYDYSFHLGPTHRHFNEKRSVDINIQSSYVRRYCQNITRFQ